MTTPCFAGYAPLHQPSGECRVVNEHSEVLRSYPPFDFVKFYIEQDAEDYRRLIDGTITKEQDKKEWRVIETQGMDTSANGFLCYEVTD